MHSVVAVEAFSEALDKDICMVLASRLVQYWPKQFALDLHLLANLTEHNFLQHHGNANLFRKNIDKWKEVKTNEKLSCSGQY